MKTEKSILIAFVFNLAFSVFEFIGGIFTGSIAIASDAIHDIGDAAAIGISYFLEKQSKRQPDNYYTYGYARYSVLGSVIISLMLLFSSLVVIYNAVNRIVFPTFINYNGVIIFAVVGLAVNFAAAVITHGGGSLNQKAVSLHMLEDVLGWAVVLAGGIIMRFTDFALIDPIMSIGVAVFIFMHAFKNLKQAAELFLEKTPDGISVDEIKEHLSKIEGVQDVHHIHIWSIDGKHNYATVHIVTDNDGHRVKHAVRDELLEHGIGHVTIELESADEHCHERQCRIEFEAHSVCCHHHH